MIAKNNILFLTEGKSYEQDIFANAVKKYGLNFNSNKTTDN